MLKNKDYAHLENIDHEASKIVYLYGDDLPSRFGGIARRLLQRDVPEISNDGYSLEDITRAMNIEIHILDGAIKSIKRNHSQWPCRNTIDRKKPLRNGRAKHKNRRSVR